MKNKLFTLLFTFIFTSGLGVVPVSAQTVSTELGGFAWSSNIGWISLNCKTGGASGENICAISDYQVILNADNTLTGFAWSSNIGWIKFGGLASFPSGSGTFAGNARAVGSYPNMNFEGWARACAGTDAPSGSEIKDCSSMTKNDNSGDWDGWISLRGTGYGVSTTETGPAPDSFAWGGDVVGWIDMYSHATWLRPTATISAASCAVALGSDTCNTNLSWDIQNATSPRVNQGATQLSTNASSAGTAVTLRLGDNYFSALDGTSNLRTINVVATCTPGTTDSNGVTCEIPPPAISITTSKDLIRKDDVITVSWTVNPSPVATGSCSVSGLGFSTFSTTTSGSRVTAGLTSASQYKLECTGPYGSVASTTRVNIIPTVTEV